ncbi:MAG: WD40/YVTN/BNR-like repeat-containing protein, partial [Candidatus Limnocylindrales bacterium]
VDLLAAADGVVVGFGRDATGLMTPYRSTDGLVWTAVPEVSPLAQASAVAIGARPSGAGSEAPTFVAVGSYTQGELTRAASWVSNGDGWKADPGGADLGHSSGAGSTSMSAVTFGSGVWVAGGIESNQPAGQDGVIWTSTDGWSWRRVALPDPGDGINDVAVGGPGFVAVGVGTSGSMAELSSEHAAIWTSGDGSVWTRVPDSAAFDGATIRTVIAGGPGLIAMGNDYQDNGVFSPAVWTSTDGLAWTREPAPADPNPSAIIEGNLQGRVPFDVAQVQGGYVAVGMEFGLSANNLTRAAVWTSVDGRSWGRLPHTAVLDGGEGGGFGMQSVNVVGDRVIALGATAAGPTIWVSPPAPGGAVMGSPMPVPTPPPATPAPSFGATPAGTPAGTAPAGMLAGDFRRSICEAFVEFELAFGNDAGAMGPVAQAYFDALTARDPEAIVETAGPVRGHIEKILEIARTPVPWEPSEEVYRLLERFAVLALENVIRVEDDARLGVAPADAQAAFFGEALAARYHELVAAIGPAMSQLPDPSGCDAPPPAGAP